MSKAEILDELTHLSPEDLAEVQAYLDQLVRERNLTLPNPAHLRSPRLANPSQRADFRLQITEIRSDAGI